ncbi:Outer membrane receptor proteins, mostly Fe transport [Mucilaginibacter mallensis]|uniref:Outer membrane receptor proteins, mostly Fe transport n=1 Tax=Mucilaginibacter mallensis TaxID=652787 RepID=A0A1H2CFJ7_MUCMA|nr:TonB-dependent receptor [Mucilaginibacter mallensis]SDT69012.1 Outer membrane receptor proteins, mostly Fe transport [Mucilaginibacter mallensis]
MKKILILGLLLLPVLTYAQQQIKGTVIDATGQPLDAVTISLSLQTKNISNALADTGKFILTYPTGGFYQMTATLVGYKPFTRMVRLPKDSLKIIMQSNSKQLEVVTISASKPVIERSVDRVTFNVENSIIASGGTAWDALSKAPGVQTTSDNSLTENRKSVQVYMDGKPLNLSGDDLANYLQGMPSDLISKIEVFSNPPSNFDGEGGAVINIITKKSKGQGFNATVNGGFTQATYTNYTLSTSFNYRKDKLNLYGSYGNTDKEFGREQHDYIDYLTPTGNSYWNSPGYNVFHGHINNYRLGADYQLTDNQILGVLISGTNRTNNVRTNTPTTVTNENTEKLDSSLFSNGNTAIRGDKYDFDLNYNIKIDTGGKNLNVDVDYAPYRVTANQYVNNFTYLPDGSLASAPYHIFTPTSQNINIYSAKVDYTYKLGKIWSLSSGIKYSSIQSQNIVNFYNVSGPQPAEVSANNDNFDYTENTAAAYTSVSGSFGKWDFEGGLRGELTHTRGYSETLDSLNTRQYFKLFPTLFAVYKIDKDNALQFTYSYRVDRPSYGYLNPARHYATPYNYLQGNPDLQPSFTQDIELGYTFKKDYAITAYYTATHDKYSNVTVQDNVNGLFHYTFQNLGLGVNTGLRLSAPFNPTSWWEISTSIEVYYQREASNYLQGRYDYHKFAYDGTTTQSFTISKKLGLKAEITGRYDSPVIDGIFKVSQNSEVDAGIKATVLHGQGSIKLAAGDIFYGESFHSSVNYLNQNNGFYQTNDTRTGTLSFSYRFGKNVAASRKRSTADEEESKRAI